MQITTAPFAARFPVVAMDGIAAARQFVQRLLGQTSLWGIMAAIMFNVIGERRNRALALRDGEGRHDDLADNDVNNQLPQANPWEPTLCPWGRIGQPMVGLPLVCVAVALSVVLTGRLWQTYRVAVRLLPRGGHDARCMACKGQAGHVRLMRVRTAVAKLQGYLSRDAWCRTVRCRGNAAA